MSETVFKFPLPNPGSDRPWVAMQRGAEPLHVAAQDGIGYLWCRVEPAEPMVRRYVGVYGTGWPIDGRPLYLGTLHIDWTVWHVFFGDEAPLEDDR